MVKNQLSTFNSETLLDLEVSVDSLVSYIEEAAWAISLCEKSLEKKITNQFYSSILKIKNLSKIMQAELLEHFCSVVLDNKSEDLPHKNIFINALYEEYFMLRRDVNEFILQQDL